MNSIEEFVKSLNLPIEGSFRNKDEYIINLNNSDDFSKLFTHISLNNDLFVEDGSVATDSETEFRYTDGNFIILLQANYDEDVYSLYIGRK